jgi:metal-sulfur cluster biosynthetic enzyme
MPVTSESVFTALKSVHDPEIPLNIVDLGLVYNVHLKPATQLASELAPVSIEGLNDIEVEMTLTSEQCPSHVTIERDVKRVVEAMEGVQLAHVKFVFEPKWGPERISEEGKKHLGIEI